MVECLCIDRKRHIFNVYSVGATLQEKLLVPLRASIAPRGVCVKKEGVVYVYAVRKPYTSLRSYSCQADVLVPVERRWA